MRRQPAFDIEIIKRTATWAEQIVRADPEWQDYSGVGPYGEKLAIVDVCLKYIFKDDPLMIEILTLYRNYLLQMRKQYFAGTVANQITMLALLKGSRKTEISALERIMRDIPDKPNPE